MYKVPLRYQATEYDCGSTAIINAINYILPFSDIPVSFLKIVYSVCLNECCRAGMVGKEGTSIEALKYLVWWFNEYAKKTGFPIKCDFYDEFHFKNDSFLVEKLREGNTAIVVMCILWDPHYITLTDADDEYIYLFDPYYWDREYGEQNVFRVDIPYKANRKLPIGFLDETDGDFYSLKKVKTKGAVMFRFVKT